MASKKWRCFFCDEVFTDRRSAWLHFGEENCESDPPACIDPLRADEKARLSELREAREYAMQCQREAQNADEKLEGLQAEHDNFFRHFGKDVGSMWQAGDRYRNALYEIELLRKRLAEAA